MKKTNRIGCLDRCQRPKYSALMNSNICNDCENCAKVITIKNSSVEKVET